MSRHGAQEGITGGETLEVRVPRQDGPARTAGCGQQRGGAGSSLALCEFRQKATSSRRGLRDARGCLEKLLCLSVTHHNHKNIEEEIQFPRSVHQC
jgi:hypothetical protein